MITRCELEAYVLTPGGVRKQLDVQEMQVSFNMDRSPFLVLELTIAPVDGETWDYLDPRGSDRPVMYWRATLYGHDGTYRGTLPVTDDGREGVAQLRVRRRQRSTGRVTLTASSFESMLDDRRRNAASTSDTGATTLLALVQYGLTEAVPGATVVDNAGAAAVAIPAGDRRLVLQGQSAYDVFEAEIGAAGIKFYEHAGTWQLLPEDQAPRAASQPTDLHLYDGPAGTLHEISETTDRERWADAVLVKYSYQNSAGTQITGYQASTLVTPVPGLPTRVDVVNVARAVPSSSYANQIATRALIRGQSYDVTADADVNAFPSQTVHLHEGGNVDRLKLRRVTFDLPAATMQLVGQIE